MKEMRAKLTIEELKQNWHDSLERPTELLSTQMKRLSLKDRKFQTFQPADEEAIEELWLKCLQIDDQLQVYAIKISLLNYKCLYMTARSCSIIVYLIYFM